MKRVIKAATDVQGEKILKTMKTLLDQLDATSENYLEEHDLMPLYDELIEAIPDFSYQLNSL